MGRDDLTRERRRRNQGPPNGVVERRSAMAQRGTQRRDDDDTLPAREEPHKLRDEIKYGVADAIKEALRDKSLMRAFWEEGYQELARHLHSAIARWIGGRIITMAAVAGLVWVLAELIKKGSAP